MVFLLVLGRPTSAQPDVLRVSVDGRQVTVEEPQVEIDGQPSDLDDLFALLGDDPVQADQVDLFDPADGTDFTVEGVGAAIRGNEIALTNLSNALAARGSIGIWISGDRWRICIIITLGSARSPRVVVDGRAVTAYDVQAELEGEPVDPLRLLLMLGKETVTADKVEMADGSEVVPLDDVIATIQEHRIVLTNLSPLLASKGRLSIWVSGDKWRICVTIEWGMFTSADGQIRVDLPDRDVHTAVLFTYTEVTTPTKPLPGDVKRVLNFSLKAANEQGAEINQFDKPFILELRYSADDLESAGIKEESLQIAFFDKEAGQWRLLATEVDTEAKVATTSLDHLTEFALWGQEDETAQQPSIFLPMLSR